ncbi:transporter, putative [Rhodobacterales bacterium Y4I]|nr:transporter, putative [Rhodobacterales bacterium Y4I]
MKSIPALSEPNYRRFIVGYSFSFTLYWVTLLAIGWWTWETTQSAAWVGFMFFCDLFPAVLVTPYASALADRVDRFLMLRIVLWITVATGFSLAVTAALDVLSPSLLALFAVIEGTAVGFSQPAFFGLLNRLVSPKNLSSGVAFNSSIAQTSFVLGPLLAGLCFSLGTDFAPLVFSANAFGTLVYLYSLTRVELQPAPPKHDNTDPGAIAGLIEIWSNNKVFAPIFMIICVALLQRPLISLMPSTNGIFDILRPEAFTFLTATYMAGSVLGTLYLSSKNDDTGLTEQSRIWLAVMIGLLVAFFASMEAGITQIPIVLSLLFVLGLSSPFVWTANTIVLQNQTSEGLRSRVLGNSFMISRATGAMAVAAVGILSDWIGLSYAMCATAVFVAVLIAAQSILRNRRRLMEPRP